MEKYIALSYIFRLSTELAKDPALFYHLGYFVWLKRRRNDTAVIVVLSF